MTAGPAGVPTESPVPSGSTRQRSTALEDSPYCDSEETDSDSNDYREHRCPVVSCPRYQSEFSTQVNYLRHIEARHPEIFKEVSNSLGTSIASFLPAVQKETPGPEQYQEDFEYCVNNNAKSGELAHFPDEKFSQFSLPYRENLARVRLITGKYGKPAPEPCNRCSEENWECRIFDEDILGFMGHACNRCRLARSACTFAQSAVQGSERIKAKNRVSGVREDSISKSDSGDRLVKREGDENDDVDEYFRVRKQARLGTGSSSQDHKILYVSD
jgi:hypothetical protein